MTENRILLLFLGLVTLCTLTTTGLFLMTAGHLRQALRRLNCFLSHCDQAAYRIHTVVDKGCGVADHLLKRVAGNHKR